MKRVHLVYSCSAHGSLKHVLSEKNISEDVISCDSDLSVGPLFQIDRLKGRIERGVYFEKMIQALDDLDIDEKECENEKLEDLFSFDYRTFDQVVLWVGANTAERLLLAWACTHIPKEKIQVINMARLRGVSLQTVSLASLSLEQIESLLPTMDAITHELYEEAVSLWDGVIYSRSLVRIYDRNETGQLGIMMKERSYYDSFLLSNCTKEYKKAAQVIGETLGTCGQIVSDTYVSYRLKELIKEGEVEAEGDTLSIRTYSVKLASK